MKKAKAYISLDDESESSVVIEQPAPLASSTAKRRSIRYYFYALAAVILIAVGMTLIAVLVPSRRDSSSAASVNNANNAVNATSDDSSVSTSKTALNSTESPTPDPTKSPTIDEEIVKTQLPTATPTSPPTAKPKRPNLLFLMADQQRFDALSLTGINKILDTLHMDRIGKAGVHFTTAYTQCAVCGPARTSLLTGRSIENTNVRSNRDCEIANATQVPTYDEILVNQEGYVAEYYGKWHSPLDLSTVYSNSIHYPSFSAPYRNYLDSVGIFEPSVADMKEGTQKQSFNLRPYTSNPLDSRYGLPPGSKRSGTEGRQKMSEADQHGISDIPAQHSLTAFDANLTIAALERLAGSSLQQPFSLHCSFFCPHAPITPSEPFASMYAPDKMEAPDSINDEMLNSPYIKANRRNRLRQYANPSLLQYMTANYYAYVKEIDVWVGKILDKLEELGIADNTLVVYTSDHGEMLGSHGMREKGVFYEEASRVPLLMRFPGVIAPGTVVNSPVSHVDVFATILDYLGVSEQIKSDGTSLRPLVEGNQINKEYVVGEWNSSGGTKPGLMVCSKRWKLLLPNTADSDLVNVLFDLENDPYEMTNLLGSNPDRNDYLETAEQLKHVLIDWLIKTDSPHLEEVKKRKL